MPDRRTSATSAEPHAYSRQDYANLINGCLRATVESIIEAGSWLIDARKNLDHGEFEAMVKEDLRISPSTAYKLRAIASHPVLRNRSHVNDLPPCWSTLYELSRLKAEPLEAWFEDGTVTAKIQRNQAESLRIRQSRRTTFDDDQQDDEQDDADAVEEGAVDQDDEQGDVDDEAIDSMPARPLTRNGDAVEESDLDQQGEVEGDDGAESDFEAVEPERLDQKTWDLIASFRSIDRDLEDLVDAVLKVGEAARLRDESDPVIAATQHCTAGRLRRCGQFLLDVGEQWDRENAKPTIARREPRSRQAEPTEDTPLALAHGGDQ